MIHPGYLILLFVVPLSVFLFYLYRQSHNRHQQCVELCHRIANELSQRQEHELVVERVFTIIMEHTRAEMAILVFRDLRDMHGENTNNHLDRNMQVLRVQGIPEKVLRAGDHLQPGQCGYGFGALEIADSAKIYHKGLREAVKDGAGIALDSKQNMMCIPLSSNNQIHGLLQLISRKDKPYKRHDLEGMGGLGIYLDAAIQNASKIETIRRKRNSAQSLYAIGLTISRFQELDEILHHAVKETRRLLKADFSWYTELYDQQGKQGKIRNIAGDYNEQLETGTVIPLGGRIAAMMQMEKKSISECYILIRNLGTHEGEGPQGYIPDSGSTQFCDTKMHDILTGLHMNSGIIVPVASDKHVYGFLCSFSHATGIFDAFHATLQQRIANQLLIAINTADYHVKSRRLALIEERQRMSDDLHDNMAQVINGLSLELHSFVKLVEKGKDKETLLQRLDSIHPLLNQAKASIREGIFELRIAEGTGIWENLTEFANSFEKWHQFKTHVDLPKNDIVLDILQQSELLRVVQEALWNIHKHSETHEAWLSATTDNNKTIQIIIMDKGKGLPRQKVNAGQGIRTMHDRIARLEGELKITNNQPQGVLVTIEVPYHV